MNFNVGDQFVEFFLGDPEGCPYIVTVAPNIYKVFYAKTQNGREHRFSLWSDTDHLVAPCADCEGVCLTFYANEKVYKCKECGNEWD